MTSTAPGEQRDPAAEQAARSEAWDALDYGQATLHRLGTGVSFIYAGRPNDAEDEAYQRGRQRGLRGERPDDTVPYGVPAMPTATIRGRVGHTAPAAALAMPESIEGEAAAIAAAEQRGRASVLAVVEARKRKRVKTRGSHDAAQVVCSCSEVIEELNAILRERGEGETA